jgi:UDP-glucuronate 4-epimerase
MTVLVTGAAGFIGSSVAESLLARGEQVVGIDSMNAYYDVRLKEARLARLIGKPGFTFRKLNIAAPELPQELAAFPGIDRIVHLAAQAGVRYSIEHPFEYAESNLIGHLRVMEYARHLPKLRHMVYASSSSVYGGNTKMPFSVEDRVDQPISLYAATKKADELMGHAYSHLYRMPQTGLRFFTVYGPWGRPDMALYLFADAMTKGKPIRVFNQGDMRRDFTYVDDIVNGVIAVLDRPPADTGVPHKVYNLGNNKPEQLLRVIELLEDALGVKAQKKLEPMQPGDVKETYADIAASTRDFGFVPQTSIEDGVKKFVAWYKDYHKV